MTGVSPDGSALVILISVAGVALLPLAFLRLASMIQGAGEVRY
jgi:hypothetical protein